MLNGRNQSGLQRNVVRQRSTSTPTNYTEHGTNVAPISDDPNGCLGIYYFQPQIFKSSASDPYNFFARYRRRSRFDDIPFDEIWIAAASP
ncbi:hypothetical protein D9613_012550 [Agrocybe pediades]|uniref:Uncharacterized protein n=1 Tax=Agrocybe pediades TaxID=84607 RepID=A0A8H4VM14_9AGAR|nr:hypothetical protein D9613_012550 [Agrocybe pediades]